MRILHVVEATLAGVGRHVTDLAGAQSEAGHEVVVAFGTARESDAFRRMRGELHRIRWQPIAIPLRPGPSLAGAVRTSWRMIRTFRPHVVHGHSTVGGVVARLAPPGPWRIVYTPNAVYSMNPDLSRHLRLGVDAVERTLARRTDTIIAVSPEERDHLLTLGVDASRVRVVANGIPPVHRADRDDVRRSLGLPEGAPVLGFVGRLDHQKAPHHLLDAFEIVAPARNDVRLLVVGDGQLRAELDGRLASLPPSVADRVHLVGERPGTWAMAAMDLLVQPSRYEGFSYVLIEAAHLGLPMVVSSAAGSALLRDGPAELVEVPVGDVPRFADACLRFLDRWPVEPGLATDRRFTIERMAELTELAYAARPIDVDRTSNRPVDLRFADTSDTTDAADGPSTTRQRHLRLVEGPDDVGEPSARTEAPRQP